LAVVIRRSADSQPPGDAPSAFVRKRLLRSRDSSKVAVVFVLVGGGLGVCRQRDVDGRASHRIEIGPRPAEAVEAAGGVGVGGGEIGLFGNAGERCRRDCCGRDNVCAVGSQRGRRLRDPFHSQFRACREWGFGEIEVDVVATKISRGVSRRYSVMKAQPETSGAVTGGRLWRHVQANCRRLAVAGFRGLFGPLVSDKEVLQFP